MIKTDAITIQRVYDNKKPDDSYRVLVDKLWPRGIKKVDLKFDEWNKEIAPSTELRKWFDHKSERFDQFAELYKKELTSKENELDRLREISKTKTVSLLYGAKDPKINHAIILKNILLEKL
jgi:uncharacterized protein YeaO (DUF488 family)